MNKYYDKLLELSTIAFDKGEVPVAALVVKDDQIISSSYNHRVENNTVLNHAEIDAIIKANNVIGDWRLDECDLYVTLEPCDMCREIIMSSRIQNVYYLVERLEQKKKYSKTVFNNCYDEYYSEKIKEKMSLFFDEKRDK